MVAERRTETWLLWDSDQIVGGIHAGQTCSGPCVIHKPTAHWLRHLPLAYDPAKRCFYRTCKHGVAHQDPDERTRWTSILAKGDKRLAHRAHEKLEQWDCPSCSCGCCWIISAT